MKKPKQYVIYDRHTKLWYGVQNTWTANKAEAKRFDPQHRNVTLPGIDSKMVPA